VKSKERKVVVDRATTAVAPPVSIVGIGTSAGGLEAVLNLLRHVPLDTGLGFVLVQHLDPEHDSALTQILTRGTSTPVREVTNNLRVEANHVYVIPPNTLLSIAQGVLVLQPRRQTRTPLRSIDSFFESLAQDQRERAIGVILSGTASDGTLGLEAIKAEGGITFAQDESAKYDSMPRSAVAAGCVDFILSPEHIAKELARIAKHPYVAGPPIDPSFSADDEFDVATRRDDDRPSPSGARGMMPEGRMQGRTLVKHRPAERAGRGGRTVENGYKRILMSLRNHAGVDFSLYKPTTIRRRIARRMVLNKHNTLYDYANFLRGNAKELDALYSDVLINVTSFFRNPEAFDVLTSMVFPKLLQQRTDDPIRVWVLGCSTGQEAYSIAMAFLETAENAPRMRRLQVFATDLNDALLDKARHGLYAKSLVQDLSPERVRRFFVEEDGGYRISKTLREMVVFARQNVITDPPFSRMDLISCRNLLIYLEPSVQQKAIPTFHYALKPGGFLFLGVSESIGSFTSLFEPVDKKHKLYVKKAAPTPMFHLPMKRERDERPLSIRPRQVKIPLPKVKGPAEVSEGLHRELNAQREADRITVNQFAPPGVLINADLQILQFRGPTGAYLAPPKGKATFDVLKMAREGLMLPLRDAINRAKRSNITARKDHVRVQQNGKTRTVNIKVIPLKHVRERSFLILFEDATALSLSHSGPLTQRRLQPRERANRRVNELEADLAETRDYLQTIQEQYEAANEELQASNEEIQSANEELQSINEELETFKEELESANEELTTVNEEMAHRNLELARLHGDLVNFQKSIQLSIVLLGRNLTIRRFSAQAEKQFDLLAADVGRPISNIRHNLRIEEPDLQAASGSTAPSRRDSEPPESGWQVKRPDGRVVDPVDSAPDLETLTAEVISTVREHEREVRDKEGRWYSLRVRPYFTLDNKVDGAVLVLVDITDLKRKEAAVAAARAYAETIIETVREPLLVLDGQLRIESANRSFYRAFQVMPAETIGKFIYELGNRQWDIPHLRELLERILPQNNTMEDFLVEHTFEQLGRRTMLLNARRMDDSHNATQRILLAIEDITERIQTDQTLRESNERFRLLADSAPALIWVNDLEGCVFVSRGYLDFLGADIADVRGYDWAQFVHPEDHERYLNAYFHAMSSQAPFEAEFRFRRHDGEYRWMRSVGRPRRGPDGTFLGYAGLTLDITERKQVEESLRESEERLRAFAGRLEELVQERTQALVSSQDRLRALAAELNLTEQRERQRLASDLHDYLAQLLAVSQMKVAQAIRQGVAPGVDEALTEVQEVMDQALTYTRTLMAQLSPPIQNEFGLPMALKWLAEQMRHRDFVVSLELEGDTLPLPEDQARLLYQSARELIINAMKHGQTDHATVAVTVAQEVLRLVVTDQGAGFDVAAVDTSGGVSHFGLFSVRERMKALGGDFELHSSPGGGTQATLVLPLAPKDNGAGSKVLSAESTHSGLRAEHSALQKNAIIRVLLADDHAMVRQGLRKLLDAYAEIQVVGEAANGEEAVALTDELQPDVVLMDVNMPKMDGIQATRHIKQEMPAVIVIGLSIQNVGAVRVAMKEAGASAFLNKEAAVEQLYSVIQDAVQDHSPNN
jgi:two-component system CheB/CheR fusion protein